MNFLSLSFHLSVLLLVTGAEKMRIGLLYEDPSMVTVARQVVGKDVNLDLSVEKVERFDSQMIVTAANRLLKRRIGVLVVPSLSEGYSILSSFSKLNRLPTISLSSRGERGDYLINASPAFLEAAPELIRYYQWEEFSYIYDWTNGFEFLSRATATPLEFHRVRHPGSAAAFVSGLVQSSGARILIDLEDQGLVERVIAEAARAKYIGSSHFILTQPLEDEVWSKVKGSGLNITWLQFASLSSNRKKKKLAEKSIESLLLSDSLRLVSSALARLVRSKVDFNETYLDGDLIKRHILQSRLTEGTTGLLAFDQKGKRVRAKVAVIESGVPGMTWVSSEGLLTGDRHKQTKKVMAGVKIRVTTVLHEPYIMHNTATLRGFCKDLLDALAEILGFEYELSLQESFGSFTEGGTWTGMLGELVRGNADLALGALAVTPARQKLVDFTVPFQHEGLTLLVPKPWHPEELGPGNNYFFFHVLKLELWCCHLSSWVAVGVLTFALLRLNFDPNRDIETRPDWPIESLWNTFTPILLKNVNFQPRSPSVRVLTGVWWIYALIFFLLYCGAMSCMLLAHHQGGPAVDYAEHISTIPVNHFLKEALEKGSPTIGALANGSTLAFIQKSNIKEHKALNALWRRQPDLLSTSIEDGADRVRDGKHALLAGSALAEYWGACHGDVLRDRLDERISALALPKGSTHKRNLDVALLRLEENGKMREIRHRWWAKSCPRTTLSPSYRDMYHSAISLQDMGSIFYGLILGVVITFVVAAIEGCFLRRKRRKQTVSLTYVKRGLDIEPIDVEQTFL